MNLVNVFDAEPGMILAREVKNREGRRLMSAGTLLEENQLKILRMWGILEVYVMLDETKQTHTPIEHSTPIDEFLQTWFANNTTQDPVILEILNIARDWFIEQPEIFNTLVSRFENKNLTNAFNDELPPPPVDPRNLLNDKVKLPSLPQIYFEIQSAVYDPRFSGREIAEIVSKDPALSATLLKIVNSAYYGLRQEVSSLSQAAVMVGSRQIYHLALGVTVINYFKALPNQAPDMGAFWRHSLGCAIMAANLATHIPAADRDLVFTGGLLHDIGRLVFLSYFPKASTAALNHAQDCSLIEAESIFFTVNHAQFGQLLADTWNFPSQVSRLIGNHHNQFTALPETETAVVYFSNWLTSALGIGFSGDAMLPSLNPHAWKALGISTAALLPVLKQTDRQITEAIRFFYG
ncbi:MAG: hypothetical protein CSA29_00575 [Desulfobacterales bacterium]|nr:MAG: hypothetical protein CSA29_00575 [Desulfobacterales bacterium]